MKTSHFLIPAVAAFVLGMADSAKIQAEEAPPAPKYKIRWVLIHEPVAVFERGARLFGKLLKEASHGEMEVEVLTAKDLSPNARLSHKELYEALSAGKYEMAQTYTTYLGSFNPHFWALDLPFLFRDHKHAAKVLDGKVGGELLAGLGNQHLQGLAFTYSGGYRVIPTASKEIHKLEDFKGLRVRIANFSPVASATMRQVGAVPVAVSPDAGIEETANKSLDGMEITLPRYWEAQDRDQNKVINKTEHSLFLTAILVNSDFYAKLPAKYQKMLSKAAIEMARAERQDSIRSGDEIREKLSSNGMRLIQMNANEISRFRKAVSPVYEEVGDLVGRDLVKRIQRVQ